MNQPRPDDTFDVRPTREALLEIFALSLIAILLTWSAGLLIHPGASPATVLDSAPKVGAVVIDHIGWAFGVYVPVLLGFYVVIIGGQLTAPKEVAARIRRRLGFVAEAMVAALMPAVVLVAAACASDASSVGLVVLVLPVMSLTIFLAVQLGSFVVFEPALQVATSTRTRDWASRRLRTLGYRSLRPAWLSLLCSASAFGLAATVITLMFFLPVPEWWIPFAVLGIYSCLALVLCAASVTGSFLRDTASDRFSRILGWVLIVGPYGIVLVAAVHSAVTVEPIAPLGFGVVTSLTAVSTLWPASRSRLIRDWSLRGTARRLAAKSVVRTYRSSVAKLRELGRDAAGTDGPPLLHRLRVAWHVITKQSHPSPDFYKG
ncbi:hypothetical protein J2D78_04440 [Microbacterium maritypicum]|uniref:hypothetical protein n=1 Tax=Microbacterium maritypicum TaxID=33918 RepID=UPI001B31C77C|nr:hypothetical protein [Microbacterium liquefaciens]MBP5801327.1 hypothetical protein [Microbacterium liquefaciens]